MTPWTRAHRAPLCPWDSPGKNTGMGCHFFLQGIFPTQGSNPCLLHWQTDSLPLSQQGSPSIHLIPSNPCFSFRHPNSLICLLYYMFSDIFLLQYYFGQCDISVLVLHWRFAAIIWLCIFMLYLSSQSWAPVDSSLYPQSYPEHIT